MLDQSHNVTDPVESLMTSAIEVSRAYIQAHLVDREQLLDAQKRNDALLALSTLKDAFTTDVSPILATARMEQGGAVEPLNCYRASNYRQIKAKERPAKIGISAGIV
jgi:L-rhamnose isomerase/sugar isomerase